MTHKEAALLKYLEFNLIALVETIKPHLKEDTDQTEIYAHAHDILRDVKNCVVQPTGIPEDDQKRLK